MGRRARRFRAREDKIKEDGGEEGEGEEQVRAGNRRGGDGGREREYREGRGGK
jgi:hypothetical protein